MPTLQMLARAAALAAGVLALTPVHAGNHATVSHGDLDLASAQGRKTLERRVAVAADRVCHVEHTRELARAIAQRACATQARASAAPALAKLFGATGVQVATAGGNAQIGAR
jgi:UrcA family protein